MRRRAGALLLAAGLVAGASYGCSSTGDRGRAGDPADLVPSTPSARTPTLSRTSSPSPSSVVRPTQGAQARRLAALARLAEQAAAAQPTARVPEPRSGEVEGADVSWPQCPRGMGIPERRTLGRPMPLPSAEYVVVGLTNGPGPTTNPCLADQVAWVRERHLMAAAYAVVSFPEAGAVAAHGSRGPYDVGTRLGRLANTGYQQALAHVVTMRRAGLASPVVWVDVEPVPDFEWSGDREANAAVVEGAARGFADAGYRVGVYSTPLLWSDIVGGLSLGVPEWRAAGPTSRAEARERCGGDWSIQGGRGVLGQWVDGLRDRDITCPGVSGDLGRWFQRY